MCSNVYVCSTMLVCLILAVTNVSSYAIDQTASSDAAALQVLNEFRTHLKAEGVVLPSNELTVDNFDELEVLRLLPMIVGYMKSDALSSMEQDAFEHIYGSIWELVVEESHRHRGQPRNPILTALLASPEIRHTQPENPPKLNNNIDRNLISKEFNPDAATSVSQEAPSQRVLHTAAAIVQKYYLRQTKHKSINKRKTLANTRRTQRLRNAAVHTKQLSADSIRVTIELPRYKRSIASKPKPSTTEDVEDVEDAEMEAKILAAIQAQIGHPSLEEEEDEDDEENEPTNEPEEDSSEYLDDEADYMGILGDDDDDDDDDDDEDDDDEDEENYESRLAKGAVFAANSNDFENPSFNELLQLAARHRAVQQQRQKHQQYLAYRKKPSNRHSSYEDY